jgi:glycosyltransferase involved in cell wall biosynthesis
VIQIGFGLDPRRRVPGALLDAWTTLRDVALAANGDDVAVTVVQPAHRDAVIERGGVRFHFEAVTGAGGVDADPVASSGRRPWPFNVRTRVRSFHLRPLLRRVASLRPDLLHVHGLSFPVHTRILARAFPEVPILVQDHGNRPPARLKRPVHRWGLAPIAGVSFTARGQAEPFVAAGVLPADVPVLEVLESSSQFRPRDPAASRARTGLDGDPCLVWIGRLDENKDPLMVIEAVSRALPVLPDARLWCYYTEAPLLEVVRRRLASDRELGARIRLLGAVPHETVQDLLSGADFLLSGSHSEGSGYAVIEALACGTTPLVTDIPSFRRITGDGAFGALSLPGSVADMTRALIEWSARDRVALRRAARMHFERALSFNALGAELRTAYRTIVARSSRGRPKQVRW